MNRPTCSVMLYVEYTEGDKSGNFTGKNEI